MSLLNAFCILNTAAYGNTRGDKDICWNLKYVGLISCCLHTLVLLSSFSPACELTYCYAEENVYPPYHTSSSSKLLDSFGCYLKLEIVLQPFKRNEFWKHITWRASSKKCVEIAHRWSLSAFEDVALGVSGREINLKLQWIKPAVGRIQISPLKRNPARMRVKTKSW